MSDLAKLDHWIDGASWAPSAKDYRAGVDPRDGKATVDVALGSESDVDAAVAAAKAAATGWRKFPSMQRMYLMRDLAASIRRNAEELAEQEILDTGKPRSVALTEVEVSAQFFDFYSTLANLPTGDTLDVDPSQRVFTVREPYGVVGIITPWNLPLNQAARALGPALIAGNTTVVKPAEVTSQSTVTLARLATEVGFPAGVINVVLGSGRTVGTAIVRHPDVRKVAFTGSVEVGRTIGRDAAEKIMPLTLELGGKSANIVFADSDLEFAAKEAVRAFTANSGQVCSAGTRLFVHRSIAERFAGMVAEHASKLVPGESYGPLVTEQQFDEVRHHLEDARAHGQTALLGGDIPDRAGGQYVRPSVFVDVDPDSPLAREEIFGPVLSVIPFDTEAEVVALANDSEYGLVGAVWTRDISRALRVADALEVGQVSINTWAPGGVQTPFGGHKNSGYGREKGIEAVYHYTHLKTVIIALESGTPE